MTGREPWLRRAGRLDLSDGATVLWSVAEGRRGRRWRSLRLDAAGQLLSDLLLETDPDGRWTRLELGTAAGLLTLHPAPDGGSAHGNVVTGRGVVPLALPWSARHRLLLPDEPVAAAALGARHGDRPQAPGPGLLVGADLAVTASDGDLPPMVAPADGLPGPSWPLEAEDDQAPPSA
jgi:hypothetical protein